VSFSIQHGRPSAEVGQKKLLGFFGALDFDRHAQGGIEHIAGKHMCVCQLVDPRAEANALHPTGHVNLDFNAARGTQTNSQL